MLTCCMLPCYDKANKSKHDNATGPTRYTINRDGTLEKWYLHHDDGEIVYLRKTPRPKWNCCMKEFPAADVYETYRAARKAQKGTPQ